jgi:hypothetical protein
MSVTKLKTIRHWPIARWQDDAVAPGSSASSVRGRVITGMLTGGDAPPDLVAPGPSKQRE